MGMGAALRVQRLGPTCSLLKPLQGPCHGPGRRAGVAEQRRTQALLHLGSAGRPGRGDPGVGTCCFPSPPRPESADPGCLERTPGTGPAGTGPVETPLLRPKAKLPAWHAHLARSSAFQKLCLPPGLPLQPLCSHHGAATLSPPSSPNPWEAVGTVSSPRLTWSP